LITKDIYQNNEYISVLRETADLYEYCKTFTDVFIPIKYDTEFIVETYNNVFLKDISDYHSSNIISRSNWTHHTANTFFRTCQLLGYNCDFESENRHDGIIRDIDGSLIMCSEWEIEEKTIFNEKGEINKLLNTCNIHKTCEALLFTYNIKIDPKEFIKKAYELWNIDSNNTNSRLFLITAIFKDSENTKIKYLKGLRTFVIGKGTIDIWETLS